MTGSNECDTVVRSDDESTMVDEGEESKSGVGSHTEGILQCGDKQGSCDRQANGPNLKLKEAKSDGEEQSPSNDSSVIVVTQDEWLAASKQSSPANTTSIYTIGDIDDRLSYRQGWPLLPVLPVLTSHDNVPKALAPSGIHFAEFRKILKKHRITVHGLEIAHRYNAGTRISKSTLTLCVLSEKKENNKWAEAIGDLRTYIQAQSSSFILAVEFIDHRVFHGMYTLPILCTDAGLRSAMKKKKHGVVQILNESGLPWTSLDFFWRGMTSTRDECKPTVLIGTEAPQMQVWWDEVKEKVEKKMGTKWTFEVCFREAVKY